MTASIDPRERDPEKEFEWLREEARSRARLAAAVVLTFFAATSFLVVRWVAPEIAHATHRQVAPAARDLTEIAAAAPPEPAAQPAGAIEAPATAGPVPPGRAAAADAPRTPAAREPQLAGTVLVNVNARPWARIAVDGHELGLTPLGNVPLPPGTHRFRARMADDSVIERVVSIDEARRRVSFP